MGRKDKLIIERWELKDVIEVFDMLVRTFPKIKERGSCLDRQIMLAYNRLVHLYNGEVFDYKKFSEYYFGSKQVPELKEEPDDE